MQLKDDLKNDIKDMRRRKVQWSSFFVGMLLGASLPAILLVLGFNWLGLLVFAVACVFGAKLLYNQLPLEEVTEITTHEFHRD